MDRHACKIHHLKTKFLVFNAEVLVFDTEFLVLNTKFISFTHRRRLPSRCRPAQIFERNVSKTRRYEATSAHNMTSYDVI